MVCRTGINQAALRQPKPANDNVSDETRQFVGALIAESKREAAMNALLGGALGHVPQPTFLTLLGRAREDETLFGH